MFRFVQHDSMILAASCFRSPGPPRVLNVSRESIDKFTLLLMKNSVAIYLPVGR